MNVQPLFGLHCKDSTISCRQTHLSVVPTTCPSLSDVMHLQIRRQIGNTILVSRNRTITLLVGNMTSLIKCHGGCQVQCTAYIHHTHIEGSLGWFVKYRGGGGHCSGASYTTEGCTSLLLISRMMVW